MFNDFFFSNLVIYSLVSLNIYMSMKILNFSDMTCDGSFALGACTFSAACSLGVNMYFALLLSMALGALAGLYTAFLATKFDISSLLAGIITVTSLQSLNCKLLGGKSTAVSLEHMGIPEIPFLTKLIIVLSIFCVMFWILNSKFGLAIRGIGANIKIADGLGVNYADIVKLMLALGNSFVGLAGALFISTQKFVTPTTGSGAIIVGMIAMVIGDKFVKIKSVATLLLAVFVGTLFYESILFLATHDSFFGVDPVYANLITGTAMVMIYLLKDLKDKDDTN